MGIGNWFGWGKNGKAERTQKAGAYGDMGWRMASLSGLGWGDPEREEKGELTS